MAVLRCPQANRRCKGRSHPKTPGSFYGHVRSRLSSKSSSIRPVSQDLNSLSLTTKPQLPWDETKMGFAKTKLHLLIAPATFDDFTTPKMMSFLRPLRDIKILDEKPRTLGSKEALKASITGCFANTKLNSQQLEEPRLPGT